MVYMNTSANSNNDNLRQLVHDAGLTQPAALELLNRHLKYRPVSDSAWKSYFCTPGTTRYRRFSDDLLVLANNVFGPLKK